MPLGRRQCVEIRARSSESANRGRRGTDERDVAELSNGQDVPTIE